MIHDTLTNADRYASLHPLFPRAVRFMRENNLHTLEPGKHQTTGRVPATRIDLTPVVAQHLHGGAQPG